MSFIQILGTLRAYGADVLLLALGVTLTVSLLKKTVMKNVSKKVFVFLPFLVGLIYYAAFHALVTLSAAPFTTDIANTLEGGFACGCAATLYYVVYEQFVRGSSVSPLYPLLEGVVPESLRAEAANALYEGCKELDDGGRYAFLQENLNAFADPVLSDGELDELAQFLAKYLKAIGK